MLCHSWLAGTLTQTWKNWDLSLSQSKGYSRRWEHCHVCSKNSCPNHHFLLQSGACVAAHGFVLHGDVHVSFPDVILRGFKHKFAPAQSNLRWEVSSRVLSWGMGTVWEQKFSCWSCCVLTELDGNGSSSIWTIILYFFPYLMISATFCKGVFSMFQLPADSSAVLTLRWNCLNFPFDLV